MKGNRENSLSEEAIITYLQLKLDLPQAATLAYHTDVKISLQQIPKIEL